MDSQRQAGFRDVDSTGEAGSFADYLSRVSNIEAVAAGKRARSQMLGLQDGSRAIDIGCGLGDDARALSRMVAPNGKLIGLDSSEELLERARGRAEPQDGPIEFIAGDALNLPFESDSFDAARVERVLQHVADPARAVSEMARVTRPGGAVVAHEPDWGTLISTGRPRELISAMVGVVQSQIQNPWIGRELAGLFVDAGLTDITIVPEVLLKRDLEVEAVIDLPSLTANLGEDERRSVENLLEEAKADTLAGKTVGALTMFTVCGRVPQTASASADSA